MSDAEADQEIVTIISTTSKGGRSLFETEEPVTGANVDEYNSDPDVTEEAERELRELGFRILDVGPATISVGGSAEQFQDIFGVALEGKKKEVFDGEEAEYFDVEEDGEEMAGALGDWAEGVTPVVPPEFHTESPLSPIAEPHSDAYHYFTVPDEVATILRATRVHRNGITGSKVEVAMPDTGFYEHEFYERRGYRTRSTILGPGASNPSQDNYGHGTGEAANIFAAAPDAQLIPVKMGNDAVGAFNKACNQSPDIITNSWGWSVDSPGTSWSDIRNRSRSLYNTLKAMEAAIANAVNNGIVVCFSAGNGPGGYGFPASHPDVIAVGGVHVNYPDLDLEASSYAASFDSSLYSGRQVPDLCGMVGDDVSSLPAPLLMLPVPPGSRLDTSSTGAADDSWGLFSGTSAAAPQVAGVVALMLEKNNSLSPSDVKKKLVNQAAKDVTKGQSAMGDSAGPGDDAATGAGMVDAKWAWVVSMGDTMARFFEATPERRERLIEEDAVPEIDGEFVEDMMQTLRSRS
ncbi:subtilisin family serine protease [Salinibacter ruber]|jgi:subtilisin family serine protease|uniref:Subtilisin family serine protease n=1 Tax=Salinibacter ruber TaxID=146919 RepID=A0A9X2UR09_9BACT|nr:S8 family serine peptidase [Salinibacter ruber]MBB4061398.1 subtilisin family serine protease [Salinibacter ruber]MBB4067870.1 subtilisin family serine protease [Salinibacter ruber]MCS3643731.1 subtilisin family serine protease [Salinibacter ruber]MCS3684814.1 subtilisin family serine protease [Salinibacter ruber]MCS3701793.1 subtilisin family serine protease [Salinibacter ruber]